MGNKSTKEPGVVLVMGKPSQQLSYAQVEKVINEVDPVGLLRMGAPTDEYSPEIKVIVSRRNHNNSALRPEEIRVIFEYWFTPGCITEAQATEISQRLQAIFMWP